MSAKAGRQDNRPLEHRDDVVTFTTEPLTAPVDVFGHPHLDLRLTVETTARPDLFVRLCDVDDRGRSWNVTETFTRLTTRSGRISLPLSACAHEFRSGHRIRLQISGGAYPRYARNDESCHYTVLCKDSQLTLPVEPDFNLGGH
ncbi:CocE/NonD family hydrolase [Amycolatopsis sp. lyj-112]|uniref:CocE/NonD family hydrolase n=1 Tax=Amycolatopsis sp. lyj-112 TaxID=2789288 RepID=UPI00397A3769